MTAANKNEMAPRIVTRSFLHLAVIIFCAVVTRAEVSIVGQPEKFPTITAAINASVEGDTIQVAGGIYHENLTLEKKLTLEGIESPAIRGTGKGSVVVVNADGCAIRGFVIEKSGSDLVAEDSGILLTSNGNRIEGNSLRDILYGIYLLHSAGNLIRANNIEGRAELESGERGAGLHVWNSPNNIFEDNIISQARDGFYIQNSGNNLIRRNRVFNLRYGLHFMNSDDNRFEENVFHDNIAGAAIMYSRRINLRRNQFVHNRGFSSFGILYQDCEECLTEENVIQNNATGIFLEATRDSVFRKNLIAENDIALQIFSSSDKNLFAQNNFIENLSPLKIVGNVSNVTWQGDTGNFWSDYEGFDLDADGIGDAPHKIQNFFEYLEGNFPRMRIYLNSPSAKAIVVAEKSFPILKTPDEFDRKPLMRPLAFDYSFPRPEGTREPRILLAMISFSMLIVSAVLINRGLAR